MRLRLAIAATLIVQAAVNCSVYWMMVEHCI